ncbi:glycosyltransferase, partial [Pelagibacteraceae bacterium]|nr:glycosyltransferase [Pelagibacteraceae bacterium]
MKNKNYNKKFKVSIIINCFNGENFLKQCIQSVINQTYKNWEIIFWDNLS